MPFFHSNPLIVCLSGALEFFYNLEYKTQLEYMHFTRLHNARLFYSSFVNNDM